MRIAFTTGARTQKVVDAIIRDAPGKGLHSDEGCNYRIGEVRSIEHSEGSYLVAECAFDPGAVLPEGLDAGGRPAQGLLIGAATYGTGPVEQLLVGFFVTRG